MAELLNIKDLKVNVGEKEILKGVDLTINENETHVLMGPNGTGKSTLGYAVMATPSTRLPAAVSHSRGRTSPGWL